MNLVQPTDFQILRELQESGRRNTAANLALMLEMDRGYVNTRLPKLAEYGLVRRVGPAEASGLYEITLLGEQAIQHEDEYDKSEDFKTTLITSD